jgi:hypothetical protein
MVSRDGMRVFFQAPAASDGNVYMRIDGTTTVQLNVSEKSVAESPQGASLWTASADGTRVFFTTAEGLVNGDDDANADFYMYDVDGAPGHHLTLVSRDGAPADTDGVLGAIGASNDGHYLYFMMSGQLVAGEPTLGAERGLYAWHDGVVRYVGSFEYLNDTLANDLDAPWFLITTTSMARVSGDGSHVVFLSSKDGGFRGRAGFVGYDHGSGCVNGSCQEVYVYGADTDVLQCASCNPSGAAATTDAQVNTRTDVDSSNVTSTAHLSRALSDDGRFVFFNTQESLVADDVNGRVDAYEYDVALSKVQVLSTGRSSSNSYFLDASGSGRDVFFVTRERLVGWDSDENYDLYDARVNGGVSDPPTSPPVCTGDSCQQASAAEPSVAVVGSGPFKGRGNIEDRFRARQSKPQRRCKYGTRRSARRAKVRCAPRHGSRTRRGQRRVGRGGAK